MKITTKSGQEIEVREADILWVSTHAEAIVEDALQILFDGPWETYKAKGYKLTFNHIGYDDYDRSIELYVSANAKFDPKQLSDKLAEFGFTMGWINFDDGSEIHFHNYKGQAFFGQRVPKEHPRWTKEMLQRFEGGGDMEDPIVWRPSFRRWFLEQKGKDGAA